MDKLKMHSVNKVDENVEKIKKLFPNCVTERKNKDGETVLGVDFEMLKQELSSVVIDKNEERYQLPGRIKSRLFWRRTHRLQKRFVPAGKKASISIRRRTSISKATTSTCSNFCRKPTSAKSR